MLGHPCPVREVPEIKILLLTNYWPPEIGAASHLYYELARALVARGHEVTVLTGFPRYNIAEVPPQYRGRWAMWERTEGVRVRRVRTPHLPQHIRAARGLEHFMLAAVYGRAALGPEPPDALLIYSPPLPIALCAALLKRCRQCVCVLNVQDIFPQSAIDLGILEQPLLIRFFEWLERRVYACADHITVHSAGNRSVVLDRMRPGADDRVSVIHNWIDTDFVRPGSRYNGLRHAWALDGRFIVSFAGTMGYSQDIDTVLRAAHLLRDEEGILFLLVGDGVETPRLKAMANQMQLPNVCWQPMQPRERYPDVLAASDASLVTLHESVATPVVPSKLLSIMAAARPALVSVPLQGDAPRIVDQARCGLCVPPEAPERLAEAIRTLHASPRWAEELGANGRSYIEEHFAANAAAAQYEALFERLIAGDHPASLTR